MYSMLNVPWTVWERSAAEYRGIVCSYKRLPLHPPAGPLSCSPAAAPAFTLNMAGLNVRFLPSYWLIRRTSFTMFLTIYGKCELSITCG